MEIMELFDTYWVFNLKENKFTYKPLCAQAT